MAEESGTGDHRGWGLAAGGLLGLALALAASRVIPPALVWGGDVCTGTSDIVKTCGVPPLGLVVSMMLGVTVASVVTYRV